MVDPSLRTFLVATGKEALEAQHAQDENFMPTLVIERPGGGYDVAVLIGGHPFDMMLALVPTLREQQPVALGLTADSYMIMGEAEDVEPIRARYGGSLERAFNAGEAIVSECLIISMCDEHGNSALVNLPYTRTDNGIVWKDDPAPEGSQYDGRMIDVLKAVWWA